MPNKEAYIIIGVSVKEESFWCLVSTGEAICPHGHRRPRGRESEDFCGWCGSGFKVNLMKQPTRLLAQLTTHFKFPTFEKCWEALKNVEVDGQLGVYNGHYLNYSQGPRTVLGYRVGPPTKRDSDTVVFLTRGTVSSLFDKLKDLLQDTPLADEDPLLYLVKEVV